VGGKKMGTKGAKAPALGRDALSLRAFDFAVFTQSGQLERAMAHLPKEIVPTCYLLVYSTHFPSHSYFSWVGGSRNGSYAFGTVCGCKWLSA